MKSAPLQSSKRRFPLSTPSRAQGKPPSHAVTASPLLHPIIQARLRISSPNDRSEQEADRVADQVMRMPNASLAMEFTRSPLNDSEAAQPTYAAGAGGGTCSKCADELRRQPIEEDEWQAKESESKTAILTPRLQAQIYSLRGGGQPLDPATRAFMGTRFGRDFGQVRIHQNGQAADSAKAINARAYTTGEDIVFGTGEYMPENAEGKKLLAHELAHASTRTSATAGPIPPAPAR